LLASATAPDFPWPREGIVSVGACSGAPKLL
jgi:hypothetical protein